MENNIDKIIKEINTNLDFIITYLKAKVIQKNSNTIQNQNFPSSNINNNILSYRKHFQSSLTITNIHSNAISCILKLSNNKILTGSSTGKLRLNSFNASNNTWKQLSSEISAHNDGIPSLCELPSHHIVSVSWDYSIKIWLLQDNDLSFHITLATYTNYMRCVIPLSHDRFITSCDNKCVHIWKNDNAYSLIKEIKEESIVCSMLQLKNSDIVVFSYLSLKSLAFKKMNNYKLVGEVKGVYSFLPGGMIEIDNGRIAVSNYERPFAIVVVDIRKYCVVYKVEDRYIVNYSNLCVWDKELFVFVGEGCFCGISSKDYSFVFKEYNERYRGCGGIVKYNSKCLLIDNNLNGVDVLRDS